jgi:DNA-binding GntR family transcriptional regulator
MIQNDAPNYATMVELITPPQRTVTEQVQSRLRDMILSGDLAPGSKIDQNDLARRFGTSVVPIREALARLQSSGLVKIVSHRGVFVEALSVEELIDIYGVRELLEEQAARLAAMQISDADLARLEALEQQLQALAAAGDYVTYLQVNREFHFTIYRAANRRHLLQMIQQLWDQSERYRRLQLHLIPERARTALFEMHAIVAACQQHDPDALGTMVRYKVHQTTVGLLEKMRAAGLSSKPVK